MCKQQYNSAIKLKQTPSYTRIALKHYHIYLKLCKVNMNVILLVTSYSNKYSQLLEQCNLVCSCHITELNPREPQFSKALQTAIDDVDYDAHTFIQTLTENSLCAASSATLLLRIQYYSVQKALYRIKEAYNKYLRYRNNYNKTRLNSQFSADVLRPKQNELKDTQNQHRVVADISHSLLTLEQQIHLNTMFENRNTESCRDIDTHQYFVNSNKDIQSIITFKADMLSYPVVPAYVAGTILGGYHFLPNGGGGHEKAGGSQNFFMRNRGCHKKNQEIIGGLHVSSTL